MTTNLASTQRNFNRLTSAILLSAAVVLPACMTINVNFPESAVQRATDDYVKELYKAKEKGKTPAAEPSTAPAKASADRFSLIPIAMADGTTLDITFRTDSSTANKIRDRQAARIDELTAYKKMGIIGESKDGVPVLKNPDKNKKLLMKKIEKLVADEKADREDLYSEVLSINKMPKSRLIDLKKSFARSFQELSPSGTWLEDSEGKWLQKP